MKTLAFDCGCEIPVIEDNNPNSNLPVLNFRIEDVVLDCPITWDLICSGNTKGIFQLEKPLGQHWAKAVSPRSIEELAAVGALLRPGCLNSGMTEEYVQRKSGKKPVEYIHPIVEPILKPTYGTLVYQEQSMELARVIAGFTLQQADVLRKAIGKKKADVMAEVKTMFFEGADKLQLISREQAEEIFSWIEKSNRYSFNKAHAVSYAINGYWSAYCKAHFPVQFFTKWLSFANYKIKPAEEINELVNNAQVMNIPVLLPDIRKHNRTFSTNGTWVQFGMSNTKGVGGASFAKLEATILEAEERTGKLIGELTWVQLLLFVAGKVNNTSMNALINTGAISHFGISRKRLGFELDKYKVLTGGEKAFTEEHCSNEPDFCHVIEKCIPLRRDGGGAFNVKRQVVLQEVLEMLNNPSYSLEDTPNELNSHELALLGISLTANPIEEYNLDAVTHTCKDFHDSGEARDAVLGVYVNNVRCIKVKRGDNKGAEMAFIEVSDSTHALPDVVAFPDIWEMFKDKLTPGNKILIAGYKSPHKNSFVVQKVFNCTK